ncbi:MAG: peptidoglycan editing factor PgeF [Acinetobacter sp.]|nr:peptidoglycan editing factor PgeF [Acinetobacter sp.]
MIETFSQLPQGVYVGQTKVNEPFALASPDVALQGFNLALHVNDQSQRVQQHRLQLLQQFLPYGVKQLTWLNQTHSTICHRVDEQCQFHALTGDGLVTSQRGHALMILTADCLPIALGNADGSEIANLHAGWRGLAQGMIEHTLAQMKTPAQWAYLGAAISQQCFEVGQDVKDAFIQRYADVESAFLWQAHTGKYYADLYAIARFILQKHGVTTIIGGEQCTYQSTDYYSYRRQAHTGRMATFVFMRDE